MTRWFYRDPLAAAWMAKHFGVRFENLAEVIAGVDGDTTLLAMPSFVNDCRKERRYFVHPDSLHLLEAKVGDVVINCDDHPVIVIVEGYSPKLIHQIRIGEANQWLGRAASIIRRNGIPFFWPEREP